MDLLLFFAACLTVYAAAADSAASLNLTAEEKSWIQSHPVLKVGFSPSFPPYSFPSESGKMVGFDLDYLDLVSQRTGLVFQPVVMADWPIAEQEFMAGRIDLLTCLVGSKHQRQSMLLSRPYLRVPTVIVSRTTSPYYLQISDLSGLSLGVVKGYVPAEGVSRAGTAGRLIEYENVGTLLDAIARGEIDATITDSVNAAYNIKSRHLTNLRLGSVVEGTNELYLGIRQDQPVLAGILNKAIGSITTEERRIIDDRWISVDIEPSRWLLAFRVLLVILAAAILFFLLLYLHNRRLTVELQERRRIQAELESAHARLALISEQKTALLRMVAHDIRSPLTGMLLATDWAALTNQGDEKTLREIMAGFRSTTQQLQRLVNDLVDAQTSEDGHRIYNWETLQIKPLLEEVVFTHAEAARRKQVRVSVNTMTDELVLNTDAAALRQVVDNLITNALKFTRQNSEVRVSARWAGGMMRLEFQDQGPGIKPEDCERIFLRYGRGAALPTGGEKSTGLGLWIVESLVIGLQGRVYCESQLTKGATFIVELPKTPLVSKLGVVST